MIEQFKERAYFEARERVFGRCIDGTHPASYWIAVKLEIARRQNIPIGLDGADSRPDSQLRPPFPVSSELDLIGPPNKAADHLDMRSKRAKDGRDGD